MKKLFLAAFAASSLIASPSFAQKSGTASPTGANDNPSACMGTERASRNSKGGDREQGEFGLAQRTTIQYLVEVGEISYGEYLQEVFLRDCIPENRR